MTYDPNSTASRRALADEITALVLDCGFSKVALPGCREDVFERSVKGAPKMKVRVYTTIEGGLVRAVGKDAIRVCVVYLDSGRVRGIGKDKRVNRVGKVDAIVKRILGRMRAAYKAAKEAERCSDCGAPKFRSKRGNKVCAALCWKDRPQTPPARHPRKRVSPDPRINGVNLAPDPNFNFDSMPDSWGVTTC